MARNTKKSHRSHFHKVWTNDFTPQQGYVYPVMIKELLPGDRVKLNIAELTRTGALLSPFYGQVQMRFAVFKDVCRNLWHNFDSARIGFKEVTGEVDNSVFPYMLLDASDVGFGSLADMLGVPPLTFHTKDVNGVYQPNNQVVRVNAMPFRLIAKIYNEWLVREHVQDPLPISFDDGLDTTTNRSLFRIGWGHDRFVDALPDQQLGPQASLPIALEAGVKGNGMALGLTDGTNNFGIIGATGEGYVAATESSYGSNIGTSSSHTLGQYNLSAGVTSDITKSGLVADLSQAASVTIPQLLLSLKMQEVGSRLMYYGSRITEWLASFWGVKGDDGRLNRSEYIGGFSANILVSPVEQTSATSEVSPQGNLAGRGMSSALKRGFETSTKEDGYIVVLCWIRPKTKYAQGLPRMFSRMSRLDYALPVFQHLAPQPIKNSELYLQGIENGSDASDWDSEDLDDNKTFGFENIYDDYRRVYSEVHGDFLNKLDYWTTLKKFDNLPVLNSEFIGADPSENMFAVPGGTNFMSQVVFEMDIWRKLAKRGTPKYGV